MASSGVDSTYGTATWSNTQAVDLGPDLSEAARQAAVAGNFRVGTTAERNAATGGAARNGVYWSDTTNGELYRRSSGSWQMVPMARTVFGHAGKTTTSSPPSGFQNMAGGQVVTIELQDAAGGMTLSENSLVIPVTGRYQVNARYYYSGGGGGTVLGVLQVNGANRAQVQSYKEPGQDTTVPVSQIMLLAAGDKLRMWSNYANSTYGTDGYNGTYIEALRVA